MNVNVIVRIVNFQYGRKKLIDIKLILVMSLILLGLVGTLLYREHTKPKKPVKVEYKFYNMNF